MRQVRLPLHRDQHDVRIVIIKPGRYFPLYCFTVGEGNDRTVETVLCIDQTAVAVCGLPVNYQGGDSDDENDNAGDDELLFRWWWASIFSFSIPIIVLFKFSAVILIIQFFPFSYGKG